MKRLILIAALVASSACATLAPKAPPNLGPQATAEFYATSVIRDLDVVRDFVADGGKTTPPVFGKATVFAVADWHESLVKVIHAAPSGWRASALAGLDELKTKLPAADYAKIKPYVDGAKLTIQEL